MPGPRTEPGVRISGAVPEDGRGAAGWSQHVMSMHTEMSSGEAGKLWPVSATFWKSGVISK